MNLIESYLSSFIAFSDSISKSMYKQRTLTFQEPVELFELRCSNTINAFFQLIISSLIDYIHVLKTIKPTPSYEHTYTANNLDVMGQNQTCSYKPICSFIIH